MFSKILAFFRSRSRAIVFENVKFFLSRHAILYIFENAEFFPLASLAVCYFSLVLRHRFRKYQIFPARFARGLFYKFYAIHFDKIFHSLGSRPIFTSFAPSFSKMPNFSLENAKFFPLASLAACCFMQVLRRRFRKYQICLARFARGVLFSASVTPAFRKY